MFDLNDKNVLITGASGGIGAAIARMLHNRGANVILSGTQIDRLKNLSDELGDRATFIAANLSDEKAASELAKTAQDEVGVIDVLINNAGLTRDNLAMRMSDEDWQLVLDVNLSAAFRLSKSVLRPMMKNRWGRIINITSVVGSIGNPGQINYASSKSGLTGMTKALAQEVASRGITVNCVSPGFIDTAMTDALNDNQKTEILSRIPAARLGAAEDVSACVLFLASEESGYVTGQTLHVNGGMAMI